MASSSVVLFPTPAGRGERSSVFCPNCGTKNSDSELKCSQCGLSLKTPDEKAKFKGTMVMQGTPAPRRGAPDPTSAGALGAGRPGSPVKPEAGASLKGTMIGVAPPDMQAALEAARAKAAGRSPGPPTALPPTAVGPETRRGNPTERTPGAGSLAGGSALGAKRGTSSALKGTMIGVAPPKVDEALAAAKAGSSGTAPSGTTGSAPSASSTSHSTSHKSSPTAGGMKGTMIGVAPPDMQAAIAAAEQARRAGPQAGTREQPAPMPSQLKGTMIGVAPPDMQAAIAAAQAKGGGATSGSGVGSPPGGAADPLGTAARKRDLGSTMLSGTESASQDLGPGESDGRPGAGKASHARVDAFQGTVLGQNPHAGARGLAGSAPSPSAPSHTAEFAGTQPMPVTTPGGGAADASAGRGSSGQGTSAGLPATGLAGGTIAMQQSPLGSQPLTSDPRTVQPSPQQVGTTAFGKTVKSDAPPPALQAGGAPHQLPVEAEPRSGSPILLLLVAVVVVGALLASVLFFGSGDEPAEDAPEQAVPAPATE